MSSKKPTPKNHSVVPAKVSKIIALSLSSIATTHTHNTLNTQQCRNDIFEFKIGLRRWSLSLSLGCKFYHLPYIVRPEYDHAAIDAL